jgi:hypothetical protein
VEGRRRTGGDEDGREGERKKGGVELRDSRLQLCPLVGVARTVEEDMGNGFDGGQGVGGTEGAVGVDDGGVHCLGESALDRSSTCAA